MSDLPAARRILPAGTWSDPGAPGVVLGYDERFLRRRRLVTEQGQGFLVDLPETVSLNAGDALLLEDGTHVRVVAADEPVLVVRGDLPRLAWHIGNRHTPCQILPDRLVIRRDHVLAAMLDGLGAQLDEATAPFIPEGGAYGLGRTFGHDHGPAAPHHDHHHPEGGAGGLSHAHAHAHAHAHGHDHPHHHPHEHGHDNGHGHRHGGPAAAGQGHGA